MIFRDRLFHEDNMFERFSSFAEKEQLEETKKALCYMKKQHEGQYRKQNRFSDEKVLYINHPLLMACHLYALGIRDDALLSATLLHDVVEDTDVSLEELPFNAEIKEIVGLVTFSVPGGFTKKEAKKVYYEKIKGNAKACAVKVVDRCNNVATMAGSFSDNRLKEYIQETEEYIIPLTDELKKYPEYSDMAFQVKYQILSVIETIKCMLNR